eukprot:GHVU01187711.1.p1 GENE.GHVU01187711.1~~GHVU01187711.1.p1  ORF type:complete len:216 (-),score=17.80 GHVU01187711.1:344-991(-)
MQQRWEAVVVDSVAGGLESMGVPSGGFPPAAADFSGGNGGDPPAPLSPHASHRQWPQPAGTSASENSGSTDQALLVLTALKDAQNAAERLDLEDSGRQPHAPPSAATVPVASTERGKRRLNGGPQWSGAGVAPSHERPLMDLAAAAPSSTEGAWDAAIELCEKDSQCSSFLLRLLSESVDKLARQPVCASCGSVRVPAYYVCSGMRVCMCLNLDA